MNVILKFLLVKLSFKIRDLVDWFIKRSSVAQTYYGRLSILMCCPPVALLSQFKLKISGKLEYIIKFSLLDFSAEEQEKLLTQSLLNLIKGSVDDISK